MSSTANITSSLPSAVTFPAAVSPKNTSDLQYTDVEIFPPGLHWTINIIMVLTTLLGVTGNGLIFFFFVKKKIRFISFNFLLLNLSIADFMADLFAYLHIFIDLKTLRNFSKNSAGILCAFTIGITPYAIMTSVSIMTLTYISMNRFVFIVYPMKTAWFKSLSKTVCCLFIVWIVSIALVFPNVLAFRYEPQYGICRRQWPKIINVPLWSATGIIIGLLLPITVMLITLFATIRQYKKIIRGTSSNAEAMRRKKRTIKLLGLLILAFFVCVSPSLIYLLFSFLVKSVWPQGIEGDYTRMRWIRVTFMICLINTVADPLIYGYYNNEFQTCFKDVYEKIKGNFVRIRGKKREFNDEIAISAIEMPCKNVAEHGNKIESAKVNSFIHSERVKIEVDRVVTAEEKIVTAAEEEKDAAVDVYAAAADTQTGRVAAVEVDRAAAAEVDRAAATQIDRAAAAEVDRAAATQTDRFTTAEVDRAAAIQTDRAAAAEVDRAAATRTDRATSAEVDRAAATRKYKAAAADVDRATVEGGAVAADIDRPAVVETVENVATTEIELDKAAAGELERVVAAEADIAAALAAGKIDIANVSKLNETLAAEANRTVEVDAANATNKSQILAAYTNKAFEID